MGIESSSTSDSTSNFIESPFEQLKVGDNIVISNEKGVATLWCTVTRSATIGKMSVHVQSKHFGLDSAREELSRHMRHWSYKIPNIVDAVIRYHRGIHPLPWSLDCESNPDDLNKYVKFIEWNRPTSSSRPGGINVYDAALVTFHDEFPDSKVAFEMLHGYCNFYYRRDGVSEGTIEQIDSCDTESKSGYVLKMTKMHSLDVECKDVPIGRIVKCV